MEDFPLSNSGKNYGGGATPEKPKILPEIEQVEDMVHLGRDIQRHDGAYYLKPLMHRANTQMLQFIDHRDTDVELWFEHVNEISRDELLISHGIVDESSQFLLYRHALSFKDILKPNEIVSPQQLLRATRIDKDLINDTHPGIKRNEIFEPATMLAFMRYYEDMFWLRNHMYLY